MLFKITSAALILFVLATQAFPQNKTRIDQFSVTSLLLVLWSNKLDLGTATGFVVQKGSKYYLVTNWHVIAGRRPDNNLVLDAKGRAPDQIRILQNTNKKLGEWHWVTEDLYDPTTHLPRWIEHALGRRVDLVMLPLESTDDVQFYPLDLELRNKSIELIPASEVSIVGFPFGNVSSAGLPIWKAGSVASDPDVNYQSSAQFLVDTTSRPGMSGSPVYARRIGSYRDENGNLVIGSADKFLGVYAGDIDSASEVGRVWKASALMEIYDSIK
ncbi:MAG: serine protease [Acidobacteriia bacterium]|nr:serine protease [Terriglobia bacterium]